MARDVFMVFNELQALAAAMPPFMLTGRGWKRTWKGSAPEW
jgi:hypothetical protein